MVFGRYGARPRHYFEKRRASEIHGGVEEKEEKKKQSIKPDFDLRGGDREGRERGKGKKL